jgi:hypothetical protein
MKRKWMYVALAIVVLSGISFAPFIAGGETEYGSECSIANVAPLIEESSFFQSNHTICMGESVEFAISVSDANGAADVSSVMVMLSDDEDISEDDLSIHLDRIGTGDATTAAFGKNWTVAGESGLKNILIATSDNANLVADNNGVKVGTIELNPMIGFEVKNGTGRALTTVSFPVAAPGAQNLSSNQNAIQINNIGGVAIDVYIHGTNMTNGNETIPISCIRVGEMPMSTTPQLIADKIEPSASSSHNIYVDYPTVVPAGTYQGTVVFEITA